MTVAAEELLRQALKLDADERELLAMRIMDSIEKEPGYDEAWEAEIQRRIEAIDSGQAEMIPWEVVRQQLFERLDGKRSTH